MNSWSVAQRLINYDKHSFVRVILKLGYICTALSVAIMIIAFAVIAGFQKEITEKIFGFWGHIQVNSIHSSQLNATEPIHYDARFVKSIDSIEGVKHSQSFAFMPGVLTHSGEMDGIVLKGVSHDFHWVQFEKFLKKGKIINLEDTTLRGILISQTIANKMKLNVGDRCRLSFVIEEEIVPRMFTVTGIYSTGLEEYDQKLALINLNEIRKLNNWSDDEIGGHELFIDDLSKIDLVADKIYDRYLESEMFVETIREKFPSIFDWLKLQGTNQYVVLILMLAVALINIITVLLILILERTKMIGILKALGAKTSLLKRIFMIHGMQILIKGLVIGNILGLLFCFVQKYGKVIKLNEADYYLNVAPIHLQPTSILLLNVGTISITLLFLVIPAMLIGKISPIKAIGYR